jgi:hypothetical protein
MTESIDVNAQAVVTVSALRDHTKRAIEVQSELSQKLLEVTKHYLEQAQRASTEAWELFWRINTTPSISERIEAYQTWMRGVTERSASNAGYFLETARSLSEIEMRMLKTPSNDDERGDRAA